MNDGRRAVMEDYRKTVMVVDSRPEERDAVKMMLSEDYKVLEATGAGDAMLQISCKSMVIRKTLSGRTSTRL